MNGLLKWGIILLVTSLLGVIYLIGDCYGEVTKASWYSTESCKREGTSGITADGSVYDDNGYSVATWSYPLGATLKVVRGKHTVYVKVTDRGPGKKALSRGVTLDLSKRAFRELAPLERGVIQVRVEKIP